MKIRTLTCLIGVTLVAAPAISMAAVMGTDYGVVITRFETIATRFTDVVTMAALVLFGLLAALDTALWILKQLPIDDPKFLMKLARRVAFYGFLIALMKTDWLLEIIMGFVQLGEEGSNMQDFKPTDLMREGLNLISTMVNQYNSGAGGTFAILTNPFAAFTLGFCVIATLISFAILVAQYIVVWLQMYIYLAIVPILISLGAFSYTKDIAMKSISTTIVVGVRFLTIYLVMAIAKAMVPDMGADIAEATLDNIIPLYSAVGMAILLFFLALKAPTLATDLLNGTSSLSAGDAASMPGVAAAAGAAAGAVTGGISSAASAAGKAANDGFTPLREAVAAATSGSSPSSTSGFSPDAGTGDGENNNGSGFSSRDLTPSWMKVENSASTATMGGDSFGTNSGGANGTGFNSGTPTQAENSGYKTQSQDANRAESDAASGGSSGPAETLANGESSGVSGKNGSELNSAVSTASSESLNANSGQAGTDFNSGPAPESGAIEGVSSSIDAASIGSGSGFQAEGGSIGGADATGQASQPNNSTVADHVSRGLQEFAQAEKSAGASVNIQAGHEDI